MKFSKLVSLMAVPAAFCATIPLTSINFAEAQQNLGSIDLSQYASTGKINIPNSVEINVQKAEDLARGRQLADAAIQEFARINALQNGPTNLDELYLVMRRMSRFDPTSSYAKQILDILSETIRDIAANSPSFFELLTNPTSENIGRIAAAIFKELTRPITIPKQ